MREGERQSQRSQSASASAGQSPLNVEGKIKQVLGTHRGHKIGVGPTLPQRMVAGASSSASSQSDETSSSYIDPRVQQYLNRQYEHSLKIYESHRMIQQLMAQMHPEIQFPSISHPKPFDPLRPPPPTNQDSNEDDDDVDASGAADLGD